MPGFVKTDKDEELWAKAKSESGKSYDKGSDAYWATANKIFHSMKKDASLDVQGFLLRISGLRY